MKDLEMIDQSDKALLLKSKPQFEEGSSYYEIWMKLFRTVGADKGQLIEPTDEQWGVSAWTAYSEKHAREIFDEINEGKRTIRPMVEEA